ncbi:MAG: signal peptidase I [Anaerolineae bacterium]
MMEQEERTKRGCNLASLAGCLGRGLVLLGLFVVVIVAVRFSLYGARVNGDSMEPSLSDGQFLLISKISYYFNPPARGDIVVIWSPGEPGLALVKRVVGLPGEKVLVRAGQVFINGKRLPEPYVLHGGGGDYGPIALKPGEYFILGDNRPISSDSRQWGPIPAERIIGKAWLCLWPLSQSGRLPGVSYGE